MRVAKLAGPAQDAGEMGGIGGLRQRFGGHRCLSTSAFQEARDFDWWAPRDKAREEAGRLLRCLNIPERLWTLPPSTFSGGEQQRVNIARGFISDHPILLLAGPERCVLATKSFTAKLGVLLMAAYAARGRLDEGRALLERAADEIQSFMTDGRVEQVRALVAGAVPDGAVNTASWTRRI